VTKATQDAQSISNRLYEASQRQNREIQQASASVLQMAQSINEGVASQRCNRQRSRRNRWPAAEKGAHAVQNQIAGMNDIRGQIQETSKRIKRLGESSLEIGEIVELISDIHRADQRARAQRGDPGGVAGEAGRGFTVVAEKCSASAERSGEATKQIDAIVKTIQADTQDAGRGDGQEHAGRGRRRQAVRLGGTGAAGDRAVSRELAELIQSISAQTQKQSSSVTEVTRGMQGILQITEETTEGTKQTNVSIGQLTKLAAELRSAVAGFKVLARFPRNPRSLHPITNAMLAETSPAADAAPAAYDAGPLSWVRAEIGQSLARGLEALSAYKAAADDPAPLKQRARTFTRQPARSRWSGWTPSPRIPTRSSGNLRHSRNRESTSMT
jgi:twitching motility protein PilJ